MNKSANMTIFDYLDYTIDEFKKDPPSKMGHVRPNSKFAKDYLYHIYEHVKKLSDEESIKDYLANYFYLGKRDCVPYPYSHNYLICNRSAKTLLLIDNFKDFVFVLNHNGRAFKNNPLDELIYPPGLTPDDYRSSLTKEDIAKIIDDSNRLYRLHNKSIHYKEFINNRLKDLEIDYEVI